MTSQILAPEESDNAPVGFREERLKRKGQLRTDMHTYYDIPFQVLSAIPNQELRKIADHAKGEYSEWLQKESESILRERTKVEPQDMDAVDTEM